MKSYTELLKDGVSSGEEFWARFINENEAVQYANELIGKLNDANIHIHCEENPNGPGYDYIVCNCK